MTREQVAKILQDQIEANPKKAERAATEPLMRQWFEAQTMRYSLNRAEESVVAELVAEKFPENQE